MVSRQSSSRFYFAIGLLLDLEYFICWDCRSSYMMGYSEFPTSWSTIKLGEAMSTVVEVWLNWNAYVSEFQLQIYILFHAAVISGYFIVAIRNNCTYVAFTQHYCYSFNARAFGYQSVSALMGVNGYQCTRLFIYLAVLIYQIIWSWQLYMHRKIEPSQYLSFWVAVILSSSSRFLHFGSFCLGR